MSLTLEDRLAAVLPKGHSFEIYHLSTPPTRTNPLCSAPPDERPDRTFVENHFLSIAIDTALPPQSASPEASTNTGEARRQKVLVFALEAFIYTTAFSTIVFVSKADSTGYLHLLKLPRGTPSPIKSVTTAFLENLVDSRWRKGVQFIVSLFARAQAQYLFAGSVDNENKHVLDDRGLVRWWCRVLDPLLDAAVLQTPASKETRAPWAGVQAYLVVPGLDSYETKAFIPRGKDGTIDAERWTLGHPLEAISHYTHWT